MSVLDLDLSLPDAPIATARSLWDVTRADLEGILAELGEPSYRAKQIWHWLYEALIGDPARMTDLPQRLREALSAGFVPNMLVEIEHHDSADGSRKVLWEARDGARFETVAMPQADGRLTLCLSSQVGCALKCSFCATGTMGLKRQLTSGEFLEQVIHLHREWGRRPDNLVLMGMGEPLHNRAELGRFLDRLADPEGSAMSLSRVTLSTVGLLDALVEFNRAYPQVNLAISLVSPFDAMRSDLMPINRRYPIAAIVRVLEQLDLGWGARVTLEYPLMAGVNDRPEDARELVRVFGGKRAKVNLIPYNRTTHADYARPEKAAIEAFQARLKAGGLPAFIRWSKAEDIAGACGQLVVSTSPTPPSPLSRPERR